MKLSLSTLEPLSKILTFFNGNLLKTKRFLHCLCPFLLDQNNVNFFRWLLSSVFSHETLTAQWLYVQSVTRAQLFGSNQ